MLINNYCNYLKWTISPKMKGIRFKIMNNSHHTAEISLQTFLTEVDLKGFCLKEPVTIQHLFHSGLVTLQFRQELTAGQISRLVILHQIYVSY